MPAPPVAAANRLRILHGAAWLAAVFLAVPGGSRRVLAQPKLSDYPFQFGLASGDLLARGFVI